MFYRDFFKILLDKLIALFLLIILSPIFLVLIVLLAFEFKRNPFFVQSRIGYRNKVFNILKFRKMTEETDEFGNLLSEEERLTKLGRFIRRTSLDELPQFINVLKGDMSLVGPRPLLTQNLPYYTPRELKRHNVRPGITGWAQVNGKFMDWNKRLEYDLQYIDNVSFLFDMKIFIKTFYQVFEYFFSKKEQVEVYKELYHYRAYIRPINEKDSLQQLKLLLRRGKHNRNLPTGENELLFIDDYNDSYNSFFYVIIDNGKPIVVDFYIGEGTYLPQPLMFNKYIQVIKNHLIDLGYSQDLRLQTEYDDYKDLVNFASS